MSCNRYILDNSGNPVPEPDIVKWADWFKSKERQVAVDQVGGSTVSTVFLGLDHNFRGTGPPVVWETMVFSGPMSGDQDRCSGSREQAEAMHTRMVERVKSASP